MEVAHGAHADGESYAAFTQRQRDHQRAQYSSLSFAQEQRRLRIHLRRILLLHDGSTGEPEAPPLVESKAAPTVPLSQWRREAIAREAHKARRHANAQTIQRIVRQWLTRRSDVELPSTSEWIAMSAPVGSTARRVVEEPRKDTTDARVAAFVVAHEHELPPSAPATLMEPFQVIIELLGVRDLALGHQDDATGISVDVRLVDQLANESLGSLQAIAAVSTSEDVQWDDQVLQLGVDAPDKLLRDGAIQVDVFAQSLGRRTALGRLTVALDLLETPLADKFAMTRWFPLERGQGVSVRQVKGEVRLGIRFLMRNAKSSRYSDDVWVPFEGVQQTPPASLSHARATRGGTKTAFAKPPLSPRRRSASPASPPRVPSRQPASRVRYSRAEAMSPPSSPSSYSSDSNAEFSPQKASPSPRAPRASLRRASSSSGGILNSANARKMGPSRSDSDGDDRHERSLSPQRDGATTDDAATKPLFLKRKPYKVVFQKLDWSRVGSKTDSNWGTSSKSSSSGRAGSSPRRVSATGTSDPAPGTRASPSKTSTVSGSSERLAAVANQVYAACHVTKETAPLAQMRFRNERRQWLQSLSKHTAKAQTADEAKLSPAQETQRVPSDEASLHALWTELQGDADGAVYAALLRAATTPASDSIASSCT